MRGVKAKALRRATYNGSSAHPGGTEYESGEVTERFVQVKTKQGKGWMKGPVVGQIKATGARRSYQAAKANPQPILDEQVRAAREAIEKETR